MGVCQELTGRKPSLGPYLSLVPAVVVVFCNCHLLNYLLGHLYPELGFLLSFVPAAEVVFTVKPASPAA